MAKKIVFTGGGTVGHVTLNLILFQNLSKTVGKFITLATRMALSMNKSPNQVLM